MGQLEVLIPLGFFAATGWVVYVIVDGIRRRQQAKTTAEFHSKLLDRVGSTREFGEFLSTEGGARFLATLSTAREDGAPVRILRALQAGLVVLSLGIGLFLFTWLSPTLNIDVAETTSALATIAMSLGVGLLLATGASYTMSRRLGLLNGQHRHASGDHVHSA